MRRYIFLAIALCALLPLLASPAAARPLASVQLHLRRGTFDPLVARPVTMATLRADPTSSLLLVQFETPISSANRTALAAAGLHALAYIPDNALLVRREAGGIGVAGVPGVRWSGAFDQADKLAPDLDTQLHAATATRLSVRVLLAGDADPAAFARKLVGLNGVALAQSGGPQGTIVRADVPASALLTLLRDDGVLWIERFHRLQLANDRAQAITGVTAARQQLPWLDGAGQIVAVTDTGLDVQAQVQAGANPDFAAGRIVAAYTPAQMYPGAGACMGASDWSDRNGHGTHVAGSVLGAGVRAPAGQSFAGAAPAAKLVVQSISSVGAELDCLAEDTSFLAKAYAAGARVQNASWGGPTGGSNSSPTYGGYDLFASQIDAFLWQHKEHLLVAAAGNEGVDADPRDGVVDPGSINTPGTAKNVLTVGASENNRPPSGGCAFLPAENNCWSPNYGRPIAGDFVSNNIYGLAAFSSRGPTEDGRLKPELVAPGTNVISAASHMSSARYSLGKVGNDYAYDTGTSMATPLVSGMAALTRQWLAHQRGVAAPSAALVRALLLNGAANISPGQYGQGPFREIPAAWPNDAAGWGRAALDATLGVGTAAEAWFADTAAGLATSGASTTYTLFVSGDQPLRLTLSWTDYPASPASGRTLVNDLDLEVRTPENTVLRGNNRAELGAACCDAATGADRCNPTESLEIVEPTPGAYHITVRGAQVPFGPQPFALVARASSVGATPAAPALSLSGPDGPVVRLRWSAVPGATTYRVEESATSTFSTLTAVAATSARAFDMLSEVGTHWYRVRACLGANCGAPSAARMAVVAQAPLHVHLTVPLRLQ